MGNDHGRMSNVFNVIFEVSQGFCLDPLLHTIYVSKVFDAIRFCNTVTSYSHANKAYVVVIMHPSSVHAYAVDLI